MKDLFSQQQKETEKALGFFKYDYLIPISYWQGVNSSEEYEKKGITISYLNDKKIYPKFSVWSPTSQHYLRLLDNYIDEKRAAIKNKRNILDIGCGTGVLSFMLASNGQAKHVFALDKNPAAVECTRINAQLLDLAGNVRAGILDVVESAKRTNSEERFAEMKFPNKYELIISNPPWIAAGKVGGPEFSLDNGVFDPREEMLQAIFKLAGKHLSEESSVSKDGKLLLYYSDLSFILGLHSENRIMNLCEEQKLAISKVYKLPFLPPNYVPGGVDPLINYKKDAKIYLYEISRV
jgi:methylase of polypeptide subunit release factors